MPNLKATSRTKTFALGCLFAALFAAPTLAKTYQPGQWFHHQYTLENKYGCILQVTEITKSWQSQKGTLATVDYKSGNSTQQNSTVTVNLENQQIILHPGQKYSKNAVINFLTKPHTIQDTITSTFKWKYKVLNPVCHPTGSTEFTLTDQVKSYCGDGIIHTPNGYSQNEQCDDGNKTSGDGCSATCQNESPSNPICGNGTLETGEQCDDGNTTSGDGCSATCQNEGGGGGGGTKSYCGDGLVEKPNGYNENEECDDGNTTSGDGCSATCQNEGGGGGGGSSGGSGYPNNNSGSSSNPGQTCEFANRFRTSSVLNHGLPTLTLENGKVRIPFSPTNPADCLDPDKVCLKIASRAIVGGKATDNINQIQTWSDCLPFEIRNSAAVIPAQNNLIAKIKAGLFAIDPLTKKQLTTVPQFGSPAYFETRISPRIEITGARGASTPYQEIRNAFNPQLARLLQPFYEYCGGQICGCDASAPGVQLNSLDVLNGATFIDRHGNQRQLAECARDNVIFFDPSGGSVTLDAPGDIFELPDYPVTLIVKGADLRITDNLQYPSGNKGSLGIITLFNGKYSGHVFLQPKLTNLVGAYFLEGLLQSTANDWTLPTDRDHPRWYKILKNQLLIEGTIISQNTIKKTSDPTWPNGQFEANSKCNRALGLINCPWKTAVLEDLAFLREYFTCGNSTTALQNYGPANWKIPHCQTPTQKVHLGQTANNSNSDTPVVIHYDSRIQTNPPPGFEILSRIQQNETSY